MNAVSLAPPAIELAVQRTANADHSVPLPRAQSEGAAGLDVAANLQPIDRALGVTVASGERALIPTGLMFAIPEGYEVQLRPRSGLALKHGLTLANSPATIDSDYRGEVGVILINHGSDPIVITHGMRIAQMVLAPVTRCAFEEISDLGQTGRGAGGFGSTGR